MTPQSLGEWLAVLPRLVGLIGLIAMAVFWCFTQRTEPTILAAFGSLVAVGQGTEALRALRNPPPVPPPVPDTTVNGEA